MTRAPSPLLWPPLPSGLVGAGPGSPLLRSFAPSPNALRGLSLSLSCGALHLCCAALQLRPEQLGPNLEALGMQSILLLRQFKQRLPGRAPHAGVTAPAARKGNP
ncbi:hypothetical protein GCM10025871_37670 [Deinococcus metallilatus]|nr:hypothetical protein GCM10025871_37670 [Deinococcus metallilatus]